MITGTVNSDREPIIKITVRDSNGQDHEREAVIDTGFTGRLTLPPDFIAMLGLSWREWGYAILADGSRISFNVYDAVVVWDGQPISIPVDEADAMPLVGMALMYGYELLLPVLDGATFQLHRIPTP